MKSRTSIFVSGIFVYCGLATWLPAEVIVDFEDLALEPDSFVSAGPGGGSFKSQGVEFQRTWEFECCAFGWTYSNMADLSTRGFTNRYSAYALPAGGGASGSRNFGILDLWTKESTQIDFPVPTTVQGMHVTNTTYAYHAIASGDDGNETPFVKGPFQDGDWFKLEVDGFDENGQMQGSVEFLLADFLDGKAEIVSDWNWVDLTPLGQNVSYLQFDLSSTDNNEFGMATPAYFAMDNLTIANVPEPELAFWVLPVMIVLRHRCAKIRS